jgi:hypothetical protein
MKLHKLVKSFRNKISMISLIKSGILLIMICPFRVAAQEGLDGVIVEQIPVSTQAAADDPNLPANAKAYRIFIDMSSGYEMQGVFAEPHTEMLFGTTTKFYNNSEDGGTNGRDIPFSLIAANPALGYDTYITVNAAANNKLGIPLEEDVTDGTVDGYISGTALGLQTIGADFDLPFGVDDYTGNFSANDCVYIVLGGEQGPTDKNRVLIGQFTTDGIFSFKINIQLREISTGYIEQYVAELPVGLQYTHPGLHFPSPVVTITSPEDNDFVGIGQNLEIQANAIAPFGISHLEFFVNEVKIEVDPTAPYQAVWNTTEGTAEIIAVAWDSLGLSDTSDVLTIQVKDVKAPTVEITAPISSASFSLNQALAISVTALDEDGSITLVEFYSNDEKIGQDNTPPFELNWTPASAGSVVLHAVATDDDNLKSTSTDITITITPITSIDNLGEENVRIFPNPATSIITIELPADAYTSLHSVEILDMYGRSCIIKSFIPGSFTYSETLDVSQLPAGLYNIQINTTGGATLSKKLIIE